MSDREFVVSTRFYLNSFDFTQFNTTVQRNFPIESTDHHRSFSSDVLV